MVHYIAFLRAVNVGGHNVVRMDALVKRLQRAGLENVSTYRQSGNLLFDSATFDPTAARKMLQDQLEHMTDAGSDAFIFSMDGLRSLIGTDPFHDLGEGERAFATFMSDAPRAVPPLPLILQDDITLVGVIDRVALSVVGKDIGSGPLNDLVEKRFGVRSTTRNWSTVKGVVENGDRGWK